MRITVACPEAMIGDANNLAMVLAYGPADALTYGAPGWQDAAGNRYACCSFEASDAWISAAQSNLARPEWDADEIIDMEAATRAQAALVFSAVPFDAVPAALNVLAAYGGISGLDAISEMGLTVKNADQTQTE